MKINNIKLSITTILLVFTSVFTLKAHTLTNSTNTPQTVKIPFDFSKKLPIIEVKIKGKTYHFLFDTGMPTAFSKELMQQFKEQEVVATRTGTDANNTSFKTEYRTIDKITIGGIVFKNIPVFSLDFSVAIALKCLNIDGVIGNNLIKDAIWELDYQKKEMQITKDINTLSIPKNTPFIKFSFNEKRKKYAPYFKIQIGKQKNKRVVFDTGSNGGIKLSYDIYKKGLDLNKTITSFGVSGTGVQGLGENRKFWTSKVKEVQVGNLTIKNTLIALSDNGSFSILGNEFLKNYRIIIDYNSKKIHLIQQKEPKKEVLKNFGFVYAIKDNKATIALLFDNTQAVEKLQLNDEVLKINQLDVRQAIQQDICKFLDSRPLKDMQKVNLTILRNGKTLEVNLEKKVLLE